MNSFSSIMTNADVRCSPQLLERKWIERCRGGSLNAQGQKLGRQARLACGAMMYHQSVDPMLMMLML